MMPGAYNFLFFVCVYVGTCTRMYVLLYECVYIRTYVRDPVRLRRHLYQVEFCSFIGRYPTAGASMYCGHISSLFCCFFSHKTEFDISYKLFIQIVSSGDNLYEM